MANTSTDLARFFQPPPTNSLDNGWLQALFGNDILPGLPLGGPNDFDNAASTCPQCWQSLMISRQQWPDEYYGFPVRWILRQHQ